MLTTEPNSRIKLLDAALAAIRSKGYFRSEILQGDLPDFTCLPGTMVQETFVTHLRRYVASRLSPTLGLS